MARQPTQRVQLRGFSGAFKQMCSFAAIANTRSSQDTLPELILQALVLMPESKCTDAEEVSTLLGDLFGVGVPLYVLNDALERLVSSGRLRRSATGSLESSQNAKRVAEERIAAARSLGEAVKADWATDLVAKTPEVAADDAWQVLNAYLARVFRRHGIQAAALLDTGIGADVGEEEALASLLDEAVQSVLPRSEPAKRDAAKSAVKIFFGDLKPLRAKYVSKLADGVFHFCALGVAPETVSEFRKHLAPLIIFFDTNFLIRVLGIETHPEVQCAQQLLGALTELGDRIKLRYHTATLRELQNTIVSFRETLRSRRWSKALSRAAIRSPFISGIEFKFHAENARIPVDVEAFFKPFEHVDVLLESKGVQVYRPPTGRLEERADLYDRYNDYLLSHSREKLYSTVDHDATVLDAVRAMRSGAKNSIEAGALLLTCDYSLFGYDWQESRRQKAPACVVLPNVLCQILRPFIRPREDFDRAFAETFGVPEFRSLGGGGASACRRALSFLACYGDVPEETAASLLSNDLLLDRIKGIRDDAKVGEIIESEIVRRNEALVEERAALEAQIKQLNEDHVRERGALEEELGSHESKGKELQVALEGKAKEVQQRDDLLRDNQAFIEKLKAEKEASLREAQKAGDAQRAADELRRKLDEQTKTSVLERAQVQKDADRANLRLGIAVGLLVVFLCEAAVRLIPWRWLLDHQNTIPIQLLSGIIILILCVGWSRKDLRGALWWSTSGVLAAFLALATVTGGPARPH